jgi:hypothetical protein
MAVLDLLLGWALIATIWALLGMTSPSRANATTFCELSTQLKMLTAACEAAFKSVDADVLDGKLSPACAREQVRQCIDQLNMALYKGAWSRSAWVLGTGYLSAWQLVHRAHETLVQVESIAKVILRAHYDRMRLEGAHLPNCQELKGKLDTVIRTLSGSAPADAPADADRTSSPSLINPHQDARMTVGTIRQALNEFRDANRAGLVRSKIQLACTTLNTGLIMYAALWLALAVDAYALPEQPGLSLPLTGAIAVFLVGAVVGLFSRLRLDFEDETAVDDFGLSAMRHFAAPQLSGIAAVLGVGLLASTTHPSLDLRTAYADPLTPMTLVTAAVFGLTPALLIDRLRQQSDTFKRNLRSTDPQTSPPQSA